MAEAQPGELLVGQRCQGSSLAARQGKFFRVLSRPAGSHVACRWPLRFRRLSCCRGARQTPPLYSQLGTHGSPCPAAGDMPLPEQPRLAKE